MSIPTWSEDEDGTHCDDEESEMAAFYFDLACGFKLPDFDIWLSRLEDCGAKTELLERRSLAIKKAKENNEDGVFRHLEWITRRRYEIDRESFLLPLARHAHDVTEMRRQTISHARSQRPTKHNWEEVRKLEADLLAVGKNQRDLAAIIEKRLGIPKTTYRDWRRKQTTT